MLATEEEQAFELLRGCATWWLGEHANAVAGAVAWKGATKASVKLAFMQVRLGTGMMQRYSSMLAGHHFVGTNSLGSSVMVGMARSRTHRIHRSVCRVVW